ncbi:hypothetical protein L917_16623 [Phytophthora nicotianae]|uniref:Uncharacterized protein n=1 Tax=Phytophthora nicotianae TaxID=4792 RepID=W2KGF3_PHYNI|nr:hypothetical protein L917_16623 [Phytophthora nicotianae]
MSQVMGVATIILEFGDVVGLDGRLVGFRVDNDDFDRAPQGEHHRVDSEEGSSAFSDSSSDKGEYGSSNESADATFRATDENENSDVEVAPDGLLNFATSLHRTVI